MTDTQQEREAPSGAPLVVRIPLRDKKSQVRAFAMIDAADLGLVGEHRWFLSGQGYAVRNEPVPGETWPSGKQKQRTVSMARQILGLQPGDRTEVDHISRDKLDNRRSNLRRATHAENSQNRQRRGGTSEHRGVSFRKGKKKRPWAAYVAKDQKQIHLGFYDTEEEAARVAAAGRAALLPFSEEGTIRDRA